MTPRAERNQRVDQAQFVECLRPELARDASDVLEALLDHLCQLGEVVALRAALPGSVLGAKRDRRQRLADLVVQLACDP